jgi:hypothetical protein
MPEGWLAMKSTGEIGLRITAAQREYYRYTGASAELERRGSGSSRAALAWVRRSAPHAEEVRPMFQFNGSADEKKLS